jgi:DNA cross-link repair 1A protein
VLTHFHADHYTGLNRHSLTTLIYCTPQTARLCQLKLAIPVESIIVVELETKTRITDNCHATFFDANHCPGAAIVLFEVTCPDGTLSYSLHTGDFRANEALTKKIGMVLPPLDYLYLDTTYLDPKRTFPSQIVILDAIKDLVDKLSTVKGSESVSVPGDKNASSRKRLFAWLDMAKKEKVVETAKARICWVVGSYTIGKERVWKTCARACGGMVYASPERRRVLKCLDDKEINSLLTTDQSTVRYFGIIIRHWYML